VEIAKQKIVIVGPAHPFRGGIADTNEAMCRAFLQAGHQAELVTFTVQYPSLFFPGKTQFSIDRAPEGLTINRWIHSFNPFNWVASSQKILKLNPDVIIIRYWLPLMAPCLGSIALLLGKKVKIIGVTDNVIPHEKRMLDKLFTSYFMKGCDAFMALSKSVKKDIESLTQKPASYFPHPINDQLGALISKSEARKQLNIDQDGKYLLFFGFIRKYKGLDLLLEALGDPRLAAQNIKLIVAGESYESMDEYHQIISKYRMEDRVILKADFIPSEEVAAYFCAADLVTQTYRSATQSGITQMALHFNVPALITKVGGLDEFLIEGKTGLFSSVDPQNIADQIVHFFEMDAQGFEASIKEEKKKFSWAAFVDHFNSFYTANFGA
jgi:D-inositol-3-phosphate glycosyltransferase